MVLWPRWAQATNAECRLYQPFTASEVAISACFNYGYYSRHIDYQYPLDLVALNHVFQLLKKEGKVEDRFLALKYVSGVVGGWSSDEGIYKTDSCGLAFGPEESAGVKVPRPCYEVKATRAETDYKTSLNYLLLTQKLREGVNKIKGDDWEALTAELQPDQVRFKNFKLYDNPVWSPDGRYLLQTVWQDGVIGYEILDLDTNRMLKPEAPDAVAADALWSFDGTYVAYASNDHIYAYNVKTEKNEKTVDVQDWLGKNIAHLETIISFSPDENKLFFSGDTDALVTYRSYLWDIPNGRVTFYKEDRGGDYVGTGGRLMPWVRRVYQLSPVPGVSNNLQRRKVAHTTFTADWLKVINIRDEKSSALRGATAVAEAMQLQDVYTIQVMASAAVQNLTPLRSQLDQAGYQSYVEKFKTAEGKVLYRLRTGYYKLKADAQAEAKEIGKMLTVQPLVAVVERSGGAGITPGSPSVVQPASVTSTEQAAEENILALASDNTISPSAVSTTFQPETLPVSLQHWRATLIIVSIIVIIEFMAIVALFALVLSKRTR